MKNDVADVLRAMLPDGDKLLFMKCCVLGGAALERAFTDWLDSVGDPLHWFAGDGRELRGHLSFFYRNLSVNEISIPRTLRSYLRGALFHAKSRYRIYEACVLDVIRIFRAESLTPTLLRGSALTRLELAEEQFLRHRHDLDLFVMPEEQPAAIQLLKEHRYPIAWVRGGSTRFTHKKGLPITVHTHLLDESCYAAPIARLNARRESQSSIAGRIFIHSAPDRLFLVLAHAASKFRKQHNNWIIDSSLIVPTLTRQDWDVFLDDCKLAKLCLPVYVLTKFLSEDLNIDIPTDILEGLRNASATADREQLFSAIRGARLGDPGGLRRLLAFAPARAKVMLLREVLSPAYQNPAP